MGVEVLLSVKKLLSDLNNMESDFCYAAGCQVAGRIKVSLSTNDVLLAELLSAKFRLDEAATLPADIAAEALTTLTATWSVGSVYKIHGGRTYLQPERDVNGRMWLASGRSWHVCFDGEDRVILRLIKGRRDDCAYDALEGLNCLINEALIAEGLTLFHAAAIEIGGKACLIAGNPGSGKSTLAGCLAALGAGLIADDEVVLEERGDFLLLGATVARPLISASVGTTRLIDQCNSLALIPDRIIKVVARQQEGTQRGWESVLIQPSGSEFLTVAKPLSLVLFPTVIDSCAKKLSMTRMTPADALIELIRLNISRKMSPAVKQRCFRYLSLVSAKVPCLQLGLRRGRIEDISHLYQYLEENTAWERAAASW